MKPTTVIKTGRLFKGYTWAQAFDYACTHSFCNVQRMNGVYYIVYFSKKQGTMFQRKVPKSLLKYLPGVLESYNIVS